MLEKMDIKVLERLLNAISGLLEAEAEKIKGGYHKPEKPAETVQIEAAPVEVSKTPEIKPQEATNIPFQKIAEICSLSVCTIRALARTGIIPVRGMLIDKDLCVGPTTNPYYGFRVLSGTSRSKDLREQAVAVQDAICVRDTFDRGFAAGLTRPKLSVRLSRACSNGELHPYKMGTTYFLNVAELAAWTRWWESEKNRPNKAQLISRFIQFEDFVVHEFDVIWALTHNFWDRINPSSDTRKSLRDMHLPHVTLNGIDFYKPEAVEELN